MNVIQNYGRVFFSLLIGLIACVTCAADIETIYQVGNFHYKINDDGTEVSAVRYVGGDCDTVVIPSEVIIGGKKYPVTKIGDKCFSDFVIEGPHSVVIPSSVTSLGESCFANCRSLTSVDIPSSVITLGDDCFYNCESLTSVDIPSSVTSLGEYCFASCRRLTSVDIPSSVITLGKFCFAYCGRLTSVDIPSSVISLGDGCFASCSSLISVEIPSSVTSVGERCFSGCRLRSVVIPASVTSLGGDCFLKCRALVNADVQAKIEMLPAGLFSSCDVLVRVKLPATLAKCDSTSFEDCASLTEIIIPSPTVVDSLPSATDLYVPRYLAGSYRSKYPDNQIYSLVGEVDTSLVDGEFIIGNIRYNVNFERGDVTASYYGGTEENVVIPSEVIFGEKSYPVTSVGNSCFAGCRSLVSVEIPSTVTSLGNSCFHGCGSLTSVEIPSMVTSLGNSCFHGCSSLTSVEIPSAVTSLGNSCFQDCSSLTSVEIPISVTSLGESCFSNCGRLKSMRLPRSVARIGESCFFCCYDLTLVDLLGPITSIEPMTFESCMKLKYISIPQTVRTLGEKCFWECKSLQNLTLPASIISVGDGSFAYCDSLSVMTIYSPVLLWNLRSRCNYFVYESLVSEYKWAYPNSYIYQSFGMHFPGECKKPSVHYSNGHLIFLSDNSNSGYHYTITSEDWKEGTFSSEGVVDLSGKCDVMVYASALDCLSSDTVTATITWLNGRIDETEHASTSSLHRQSSALIQSLDENRAPAMCEVDKGICQSPTVSYSNGKLRFACDTPGASYHYSVRPVDVCGERYSEDGDVSLTGKYEISVYATADGYEPSEIVNVTLSWSDAMVDGAETGVDGPSARSVHASVCDGMVSVLGLSDGDVVSFYTLDGKLVGTQRAEDGKVSLPVLPLSADVIIARIGNQSIKVMLK